MNEPFGGNGGILRLPEQPVEEPWNDPRPLYPQIPWDLMPLPNPFGLSSGTSLWHAPVGANAALPAAPASLSASSSGRGERGNSFWWQSVANAPFGANAELPAPAPEPNYAWDTSIPSWWRSAMPFGTNAGYPATSAQPVGESAADRWAGRPGVTAWPEPPTSPEKGFADRVRENWENPPEGLSWFRLARALYDAARFPFDLAGGMYDYRPETPGVWTEEDEFRRNDLKRRLIERTFDFSSLGSTGSLPAMLGAKAPRSTLGVFVGPFGAERLTQGGLHPAVNPARALTDLEAQSILKSRQQAGDPRDADVFFRSAWFRGADGALKKELPDTGAQLVPTGKVNELGQEFVWRHPAGDIHQIYGIPPITIGPRVERRFGPGAQTDPETGRILIGADPTTPTGLKYASDVIAEEIQHAIQAKEGFAFGTHPKNEVFSADYWKALGKPFPTGPEAPQIFREHREIVRQGLELGKKETPEFKAAMDVYRRNAGEAEAKNVLRRLFERLYSQHPHETVPVRPKDQIVRAPDMQRRIVDDAYLRGLFRPPWD
jgi:hypothetical protein